MLFGRRTTSLLTLAIIGGMVAIVAIACDDERKRTPIGKVFSGGACQANPGELPQANCDNTTKSCNSIPGCTIDQAKCGSTSSCLPLGDNKGKDVVDLRFRRLNIAAPEALAGDFIQKTVVDTGIELAAKECAETGRGLFTWIMRIDLKANTMITGGAPPSKDPFNKGFCFANFELNGTVVSPITAKIEKSGESLKIIERANVNIPIFLSEDLGSAIILPIRDARIEDVTLTDDNNCIGAYNTTALDDACFEDRKVCSKWTTAGSLGGFITLEEADKVLIKELSNKSLCAFLASEPGLVCTRKDGKIDYPGDFCSTDKQPGSCRDSVWLAATFAASAAKIYDGTVEEGCGAAPIIPSTDAGADAGNEAGADDAGVSDAADQ